MNSNAASEYYVNTCIAILLTLDMADPNCRCVENGLMEPHSSEAELNAFRWKLVLSRQLKFFLREVIATSVIIVFILEESCD